MLGADALALVPTALPIRSTVEREGTSRCAAAIDSTYSREVLLAYSRLML